MQVKRSDAQAFVRAHSMSSPHGAVSMSMAPGLHAASQSSRVSASWLQVSRVPPSAAWERDRTRGVLYAQQHSSSSRPAQTSTRRQCIALTAQSHMHDSSSAWDPPNPELGVHAGVRDVAGVEHQQRGTGGCSFLHHAGAPAGCACAACLGAVARSAGAGLVMPRACLVQPALATIRATLGRICNSCP